MISSGVHQTQCPHLSPEQEAGQRAVRETRDCKNGLVRSCRQSIGMDAIQMVEAGGVEPPSEKARNEEPTCVSGSKDFGHPLQNRRARRQPSPIRSRPPAPDRSLWPIPQNDAHSPPRGLSGWSGYLMNLTAYANCGLAVMLSDRFTGARKPAP